MYVSKYWIIFCLKHSFCYDLQVRIPKLWVESKIRFGRKFYPDVVQCIFDTDQIKLFWRESVMSAITFLIIWRNRSVR